MEEAEHSLSALVDRIVQSGAVHHVDDARLVTDGMQHVVVILDDRLVARIPRDEQAASSLRSEGELVRRIASYVAAPVPQPVYVGDGFTLHTMLHGEVTSRSALARLSARGRSRLLDDVGSMLAALPTVPLDGIAPSAATTSVDRLRRLRERAAASLVPLLWRHQRVWLDEVFDAIEQQSFDHTPSVIHGDLGPYHVLHDPDTGQLTGVLDWGVAGVGDQAVDLACLLSVWGERFARDLSTSWPQAESLVSRARLVASVLPVEWALVGLEARADDMAVAHLGHLAIDVGLPGEAF